MEVEFFATWLCFVDEFWQGGKLQNLRLGLKALSIGNITTFPGSATINSE